jgi:hypothetical protein
MPLGRKQLFASFTRVQADIYSFGIVLWELFEQAVPFGEYQFSFNAHLEQAVLRGVRYARAACGKCLFADGYLGHPYQLLALMFMDVLLNHAGIPSRAAAPPQRSLSSCSRLCSSADNSLSCTQGYLQK